MAHSRVGGVQESRGRLAEAEASFEEYLAICRRLAELDPSNAGWQRDLAVAHSRMGGVQESRGRLAEAEASFGEYLAISRRLAELDPSNAGWQRDLAVAHSRVGGVQESRGGWPRRRRRSRSTWRSAGGWPSSTPATPAGSGTGGGAQPHRRRAGVAGHLAEAEASFEEYLAICRRLAELDPSNAGWQRDLAVAHSRVGGVHGARGRLAEAEASFEEYLAICRRLAELDPTNAGWQRDLAVAHNGVGGVLQAQGRLSEAEAAFEADLAISRRLAELDPSQRRLAIGPGDDLQQHRGSAEGRGPAGGGAGGVRGGAGDQAPVGGAESKQHRIALRRKVSGNAPCRNEESRTMIDATGLAAS